MQRSQKGTNETKAIVIRDLTIEHKDRIRQLMKHGDVGKIAVRVAHIGYQQVVNVLSPNHPTDNDRVWHAAIEYLNSLPKVEVDERLERYIQTGVAA